VDHLWSPWRYRYVTKAEPEPASGCVFCHQPLDSDDRHHYILHRARFCYAMLNLYPYTSGHLMVLPYRHLSSLDQLTPEEASELMEVTRLATRALTATYQPKGINLGMNLGECAGAGIATHLHMHVLPRWPGDVNFMTAIGETRVLPEDLETTFDKLHTAFRELPA